MKDRLKPQLELYLKNLQLDLEPTQQDALLEYVALLIKWNKTYNLTAITDSEEILRLHILDSLAIVPALKKKLAQINVEQPTILDVGTGAGLPAVVLAICLPQLMVDCVDAVGKKIAFVNQVKIVLKLKNLNPIHARVETLTSSYHIVTSRAFASLEDFIALCYRLLKENGVLLAMKSKKSVDEILKVTEVFPNIARFHVEQLLVDDLLAQRCIVWLEKT